MSGQDTSYVAASFYHIHNIITRGLTISLASVREALQRGFPDEGHREGFFNYVRALASVLNAHHLTEDEIAFPYFRDKLPGAPFDLLTRWHQEMVGMLAEITQAVAKGEGNAQPGSELADLENALSRLDDSWRPHIQAETDAFIIKADALIPVEERLRLVRLFGEHGQKLAVPPYLTVPFLLFNLPVKEREAFSQGMPDEVLQNLVPVVWKAQWQSMTPYLLA